MLRPGEHGGPGEGTSSRSLRAFQPPSGSLIALQRGEPRGRGHTQGSGWVWPSWWCQAAACATQRPQEQLSPAVMRGPCPLSATGRVSGVVIRVESTEVVWEKVIGRPHI